jgi:hypothetical protein
MLDTGLLGHNAPANLKADQFLQQVGNVHLDSSKDTLSTVCVRDCHAKQQALDCGDRQHACGDVMHKKPTTQQLSAHTHLSMRAGHLLGLLHLPCTRPAAAEFPATPSVTQ